MWRVGLGVECSFVFCARYRPFQYEKKAGVGGGLNAEQPARRKRLIKRSKSVPDLRHTVPHRIVVTMTKIRKIAVRLNQACAARRSSSARSAPRHDSPPIAPSRWPHPSHWHVTGPGSRHIIQTPLTKVHQESQRSGRLQVPRRMPPVRPCKMQQQRRRTGPRSSARHVARRCRGFRRE